MENHPQRPGAQCVDPAGCSARSRLGIQRDHLGGGRCRSARSSCPDPARLDHHRRSGSAGDPGLDPGAAPAHGRRLHARPAGARSMDRPLPLPGQRACRGRSRGDSGHCNRRLRRSARPGLGGGRALGRRRPRTGPRSGCPGDLRAHLPHRRDRHGRIDHPPRPRPHRRHRRSGRHRGRPHAEPAQPRRHALARARRLRAHDDRPGAVAESLRMGLRGSRLSCPGAIRHGAGSDGRRPDASGCADAVVGPGCAACHVGWPCSRAAWAPGALRLCSPCASCSLRRRDGRHHRLLRAAAVAAEAGAGRSITDRRDRRALPALLAQRSALPGSGPLLHIRHAHRGHCGGAEHDNRKR